MKCPMCGGMGTSNTCVNGTFKPCSFCDGTGEVMTDDIKIRCDDCKFVEDCVDYGWEGCKKFTQKASEPQTNEAYFCGLSTEEKAAFLANYFMFDCPMVDKVFQKQEAHNFIGLEKLAKETILEWLKQPHREESEK